MVRHDHPRPQVVALAVEVVGPRELASAPWVRRSLLASQSMRFLGLSGARDEINPTVRVEANTGPTILSTAPRKIVTSLSCSCSCSKFRGAVLSLLLHGAGVGVFPEHALREHLRAGRLLLADAP